MRAISTVIGSILILIIVIALAGTSYLYISGIFTGKISNAFSIGYSAGDTIATRNDGTDPITSFRSVKIDDIDAIYRVTKQDSSLVGYWKMDELNQTGALDSSGKGNTGTFNGETFNDGTITGATFTSGQYGSALRFDGVDDYADAGSSLAGITGDITISAWVNINGYTGRGGIVSTRQDRNDVTVPYFLYVENNGQISLNMGNGAQLIQTTSTAALGLNKWYHIATTISGNNIRIYINGTQDGTNTFSGTRQTGVTLTIGYGDRGSSYPFNGLIDEVRIYGRALTQGEIVEDMNSPSPVDRTVAWYNFENDAKDKHNIVKGRYGTALSFDGANDYADVTDSASLNPSNTITLEAWIKRKTMSSPGSMPIINKDGFSPNRDYGMWLNSGDGQNLLLEIMNGIDGVCSIQGTTVLSTDTWYHVAATHDGSNIRLFINGNQEASTSCTQAIGNTGTPLRIGCRSGCGALNSFNGTIDEVKIYNRALSAQEIKASYNIGSQINAGEAATIKIYNQLSKGTHTLKLCTSSMCNTAYLMVN